MRKTTKIVSFALCLCLSLAIVLAAMLTGGVQIASALNPFGELWLLDGVNYALLNGTRVKLGETENYSPYKVDTGAMYMPVSIICQYMDSTYTFADDVCRITLQDGSVAEIKVGSREWTLNSEPQTDFLIEVMKKGEMPFITILMSNGIFGTYNYYDSTMGLNIFGKSSVTGYSNKYSSISTQITVISEMIMDRPTSDTVYTDVVTNSGLTTHPKLLLNSERFDELRAAFNDKSDVTAFRDGIVSQVYGGQNSFDTYFTVSENGEVVWKNEEARLLLRQPYYLYDENGNRLVGTKTYTYTDSTTGESVTLTLPDGSSGYGDGYDYGGRSNVGKFTEQLQKMAFAWQITGEDKYVDAFYLFAKELDKWEHWGEGHFLNVADGSYAYAIGFDWIYHGFDGEPEKRAELADILYRKGLMMGYYSLKYESYSGRAESKANAHVSNVVGWGGFRTGNRTNNWQTVCGAGMIVSALALMEYDAYSANCSYVASQYIKNVEKCLIQYAPDGSYLESPGYWAYSTNTLMNTVVALENSCGRSYGYRDIVGFHESFYFAAGIADSNYRCWNYHDSGEETMVDGERFYLASKIFNDPTLAAYRNTMIERGHSMKLMDIIFYEPDMADIVASDMPLDNNFKNIHTATFRSSWATNATYTGLHVGPTISDHSDFDTGNFILSMGGIDWCRDPGTENYNVKDFWSNGNGGNRYHLYRKSLEGHSTIVIHSDELEYGQKYVNQSGTFPIINKYYSDDNGGYAISNMTTQYGSTCTEAYRGVLMTNSRSTVVLQDEISFSSPTTLTWVLNLQGSTSISDDGKTVTASVRRDNQKTTLRITMLTDDDSLRFTRPNLNDTILDSTITLNKNKDDGYDLACNPEPRIVIEAKDTTSFNVAVVFEILRHEDEIVGYEKVPMAEWTTCTDEWVKDANSNIEYDKPIYKYGAASFASVASRMRTAYANSDWEKYAELIGEFAEYLTDYDKSDEYVLEQVDSCHLMVQRYNMELEKINKLFKDQFLGIMPSDDPFKKD